MTNHKHLYINKKKKKKTSNVTKTLLHLQQKV